jgi:1-acyl-sn-glycerol-3-phosphate acyltransferase
VTPNEPNERAATPLHDRSWTQRFAYDVLRIVSIAFSSALGGLRASGQSNLPASGGVLLVTNHLSYLDVFVIGIPLRRRLNYVARSTLFVPVLGALIRLLGGFPIQRDGMGASGLKETLRRLKWGGVVVLFPEGTRSIDGRVAPIKAGIAVLVKKARVPIVPAGIAGTFEAWPRGQRFPHPHPIRTVYGPPIFQSELAGMSTEDVTALLQSRIEDCHRIALEGLARDLGIDSVSD